MLVYGFDDLSRAQLELIDALASAAEVDVAVTYADRDALGARAELLGAPRPTSSAPPTPLELAHSTRPTPRAPALRHLDRSLFEPERRAGSRPTSGLVLLESAGARGEAEAIGIEIARLLAGGDAPDAIAIVVRDPDGGGPLLGERAARARASGRARGVAAARGDLRRRAR